MNGALLALGSLAGLVAVGTLARATGSANAPTTHSDEGVPKRLHAVEAFARKQKVELRLAPYTGLAHGGGVVEITDLFADETGTGAGSRVMRRLVEVADAEGVNLVLHPSSGRNVTFYERFGFEMVPKVFGIPRMIRWAAWEKDDE